ncbi:MAG: diguanylate cyclase [Clostridia bacterium]|nr:diguanylate cyclase [Clostridia bacterium]
MRKKRLRLNTKTIVAITLILLSVTIIVGVMLALKSRDSMKSIINEQMLGVAKTAGALMDGDELAAISEKDAGGDTQKEILGKLNLFSANFDFEYIYIVRASGDGKFIFIVDADPKDPASYGEEVVYSPALGAASKGKATVDDISVGDEWGKFYTAYCPVMTSEGNVGGIVGIDFDAEWYESQIAKNMIYILFVGVIALLVGGGIILLVTVNLRKKFDRLNEETTSIASDIGTLLEEIHSESGYSEIAPEAQLLAGVDTVTIEEIEGEPYGIEKLAAEVKAIKINLKRYITYVHQKAYTDGMTGAGNKTAYLELVRNLNDKIAEGCANFSIAVFDVDYLKSVNDEYGHEMGDSLINGTAECVKNVFGTKNVFRIGGDEFIAVLQDYSADDMEEAFKRLDFEIKHANAALPKGAKVPIAFSMGAATFTPDIDKAFKNVFRRADKNMYKNKDEHHKNSGNIEE